MLYNKNNVRKTNDKKILHKVGKQWKVVSVALLMAVAGGAVAATSTNANADQNNVANNDAVNAQVQSLEAQSAANPAQFGYKPASATSASAKSAQSVTYYNTNAGSAAKYFDWTQSANDDAAKYRGTVNAYVNSLDAEYQPQVSSFAAKSASASTAAAKDNKLAASYRATVKNPNTINKVNSLAQANHYTDANLYEGVVQAQEEGYETAVSSASADVKAASDVQSLVSSFANLNWSSASLSASAKSAFTSSELVAANANSASVQAKYGRVAGGNWTDVNNDADKLSAGVNTLYYVANNNTYQNTLALLLHSGDSTYNNSLMADLSHDTASAVASAKSQLSGVVSEAIAAGNDTTAFSGMTLKQYAGSDAYTNAAGDTITEGRFNHFVAYNNFDPAGVTSLSDYNVAVSASADNQMAPALQSAANALYAKYDAGHTTYAYNSSVASTAIANAKDAVRAANYAYAFASVNSGLVSSASKAMVNGGSASANSYVWSLLSNGVDKDAKNLNLASYVPVYFYSSNASVKSTKYSDYASLLAGTDSAVKSLLSDSTNVVVTASQNYASDVYSAASNMASSLAVLASSAKMSSTDNDKVTAATDTVSSANMSAYLGSATTNTSLASAAMDVIDALGLSTGYSLSVSTLETKLSSAAVALKASATNSLAGSADLTPTSTSNSVSYYDTTVPANSNAFDYNAALLSDGIDFDALSAEGAALSDVYNAASDFATSLGVNATSSSDFSLAQSSANSALGSATSASTAYSSANDEDVVLASYFASSYSDDASKEADATTKASDALNNFFVSMADDDTFKSADVAYNNDMNAAENDYKLGVAFAKSVYNSNAHFLDVTKNAKLHSTYNFNTKPDKVVGVANKGDRLTVLGVSVSRNNFVRGVVRYYVLDNTTGKKGYFTGQPDFSKNAYLYALPTNQNVTVKTLKPVNVYSDLNGKKVVKTLPANTEVANATVVYDNDAEDAYGFTKVETPDYNFFTANTDYVEIPSAQTSANNTNPTPTTNASFSLGNGVQIGAYFNNYSQN